MARGHFYPLLPSFIGGQQPYAPPLGLPQSGPAPSAPPPRAANSFETIIAAHRDARWTLIYVASIAPILSTPPTIDNPPTRSLVTMQSIIRQWQPPPPRPPALLGVGQFSVAVTPDNPPRRTYATNNVVRRQWDIPAFWPLPKINLKAPPSGVDPPASGTAKYLLLLGVG